MELTKDDERARRICSLALEFMNAAVPVSSSEVARGFYPGLSADSFRRAFSRDRALLAECGIVVEEIRRPGSDSAWQVDEARSFAQGAELSATEAAVLDVVCQPLLDDPSWAFADELRMALAKLTRAFAESAVAVGGAHRTALRALPALRAAFVAGHAVRAAYTDARGSSSERLLAPYGFFSFRDALYVVAARLSEDGTAVPDGIRTYRVDRFGAVAVVPSLRFDVPADFSVQDWRRLPFQMGDALLTARFLVPAGRVDDVRRVSLGCGVFGEKDGTVTWSVDVADADAAASWAVSQGIVPLAPAELVDAHNKLLEEVCHGA